MGRLGLSRFWLTSERAGSRLGACGGISGAGPGARTTQSIQVSGFGDRGIEGKIAAVKYARGKGIPYFGLCLGLQIAVIEFARNVLGLEGANSYEVDEKTPHPVISMMDEQKSIVEKGATMRLGSYECQVKPGTKGFEAYGEEFVRERHRHRYEVNNDYVEQIENGGLKVSGINKKRNLVEMVELEDHPWFLAVQSHPEFLSKPNKAHPLFQAFIKAALETKNAWILGVRHSLDYRSSENW